MVGEWCIGGSYLVCVESGQKRGIHKEWKVYVTLIFKSGGVKPPPTWIHCVGEVLYERKLVPFLLQLFMSSNFLFALCIHFYSNKEWLSFFDSSEFFKLSCFAHPESNWAPSPFRPWFACINPQQVGIFAFKRSATVFGRNVHCNILALSSALFRMRTLQIFTADIRRIACG